MSKFSNRLSRFNLVGRTVPVSLPELRRPGSDDVPILNVLTTGVANKDYFNEVLRIGGKELRKKGKDPDLTVAEIRKDRLEQSRLFAKFVVQSWEGIYDDDGEEVEFCEANVLELFVALIEDAPHLFDRIRDAAGNDEAFYGELAPDAEELAENSTSDSPGS